MIEKEIEQQTNSSDKIEGISDTTINTISDIFQLKATDITAGTNWWRWYIDNEWNRYFVKTYNFNKDRCASEYIASCLYRKLGIPVPNMKLIKNEGKTYLVSPEVQASGYKGSKYDEKKLMEYFDHDDVKKWFIADAWLANRDIFGLDYDNILTTPWNRKVRIDNGGTLFYRAMWSHKQSFANAEVGELKTLLDPKMAREAGTIYNKTIKNTDMIEQAITLAKNISEEDIKEIITKSWISNTEQVINALIARRAYILEKILWDHDMDKIKTVVRTPEHITSRCISYNFWSEGIDLKPNEKMLVILPADGEGILKDIFLWHRKKEKYRNLWPGQDRKDNDPYWAYSQIRVFDALSHSRKNWKDPKWYNPVKYAERRSDIEYENLHDRVATVGDIKPVMIEITSKGTDDEKSIVSEYSLQVITYPEVDDTTKTSEQIFSPNTKFVDLKNKTNMLPQYGGGKHFWSYPHAIALNGKNGKEHFPLTEEFDHEDMYLKNGALHMRLSPGKKILSLEMAIGDTWFNYHGEWKKQLWWAKLNARLLGKDGHQDHFIDTLNIPPEWILSGWLSNGEYITQEWDEIIISSINTSYLMWVRLLYK